ncbi:MAG: GNAT family N-acetyltransferase [Pseudonocardiaceae bacterium]
MAEPRTRLEQLLRQRHVTLEEFRKQYQRTAGTPLSERQAYRWVAGEVRGLPYPQAQDTLEQMFEEPVGRLFGPPYGIEALRPARCRDGAAPERGSARTDWEGQVIVMSADRAHDLDDSDAILGDDRVTRWLSFDSRTREQQAAMLTGAIERAQQTPRTEYYLAATTHTDDRLIGLVRLGPSGVQAAKLDAAIAAEHWGHGYALDTTRTIITFGFTTLGLHRISGAIGPDNAASLALVTRLDFTEEGRLRDHVFTNGAWRDSLLAHEWPQGGS